MIFLYNINEDDFRTIARQIIKLWKEDRADQKANEYSAKLIPDIEKIHKIKR